MAIKLRDLKTEARTLARAKQYAAALAAHDHMLAVNPLDNDSRRKIADLLLALGDQAAAAEVYRAVAMHDVRSGHLLPAREVAWRCQDQARKRRYRHRPRNVALE